MIPERWKKIRETFTLALEASPADRARILTHCQESDPAVAAEVAALLDARAAASRILWPPPLETQEVPTPNVRSSERFELAERLGEGGFGIVFRAYDREREREVALKQLRQVDPDALARFKREFRALADLALPGLVRVHELFAGPGYAYFTMDLIEGTSILDAIRRPGPVPPSPTPALLPEVSPPIQSRAPRIITLFGRLCRTVKRLHGAGFLHRDLKPSNVLVTAEGQVVVLDFGLATDAKHTDSPVSDITGTPPYMAPEQFTHFKASESSDWYAVGVMLYEAITGRLPFSGHQGDVLAAKLAGPPPFPTAEPALLEVSRLCVELLRPNPASRPSPQTILATLKGIGSGVPSSLGIPEGPGLSYLVGREQPLQQLDAAFERAIRGQLAVAVVRGPSGIGKTSLVRHFLEYAERKASGAVVLAGRCRENETLGYRAFDAMVDALSDALRRMPEPEAEALLPQNLDALVKLFPVLSRSRVVAQARRRMFPDTDTVEQRRKAFHGLRELLGRLAYRRPVIAFIDDIHWGDRDSAALLRHLLQPPHAPPFLLIVAHRSEGAATPAMVELMAAVETVADVTRVDLLPLSQPQARELARGLLGEAANSTQLHSESVIDEAAGLPVLIRLLTDELRESKGVSRQNGPPRETGLQAPQLGLTLADTLLRRAARLPRTAQQLLEILAVSEKPLTARLCAELGEMDLPSLELAAQPLLLRHWATASLHGNSIEIYHDRLRQVILSGIPSERKRSLHRRVAEALLAEGKADPEDLAYHYRAAGELAHAAYYAQAAAERAEQALAFEQAAEAYRTVLDLSRPGGTERARLLINLGNALASAGRGIAAADAFLEAASMDSMRRGELHFRAGEQLLRAGDVQRGEAVMTALLETLGWRIPTTDSARTLAVIWGRLWIAMRRVASIPGSGQPLPTNKQLQLNASWVLSTCLSMVNLSRAAYFQTRHLQLAMEAGEPFSMARALGMEAIYESLNGSMATHRGSRKTLEKTDALARDSGHPAILAYNPLWKGIVAWLQGRWSECQAYSSTAEPLLRNAGPECRWELCTAQVFGHGSLIWMGRLREYGTRLPALIEEARARGDSYAETGLVLLSYSHVLRLAANTPRVALEAIETALERWAGGTAELPGVWALYGRVDVAIYQDDPNRAFSLIEAAWPHVAESPHLRVQVVRIWMRHLRARAALALARVAHTRRASLIALAQDEAAAIEREETQWATGLAALTRATAEFLVTRNPKSCHQALSVAVQHLQYADLGLFAQAARRQAAELQITADSHRLRAEVDHELREQGVVAPDRFAAMLVPGLGTSVVT